jgi:DNA-binding XRE family transcriptional regulator
MGRTPELCAQPRRHRAEGEESYREFRDKFLADPENRRLCEKEASKLDLWLQLVEARQQAGLTQVEMAKRLGVSQAQVARIEKRDYESYTLNTLRRYVQALGDEFSLVVSVRKSGQQMKSPRVEVAI